MYKSTDEIGSLTESFNDMAESIRARTIELDETTRRLKEAQKIGRMGSWDWDIVKNTLYWSDEIYRIFGIEPRSFGATYEAFLGSVHPDDREFVKQSVNEALFDKKPYSIDHRIMLPD